MKFILLLSVLIPGIAASQPIIRHALTTNSPSVTTNIARSITQSNNFAGSFTGNAIGLTNIPIAGISTNGGQNGSFATILNGTPLWSTYVDSISSSNIYTGLTNSLVGTDSNGKLVSTGGSYYRNNRQSFSVWEDLLGSQLPATVPGFGELGLQKSVAGTGAAIEGSDPTTAPGGLTRLATGTQVSGSVWIVNGTAFGNGFVYYLSGNWTNEFRWRITTASGTNNAASTNNYTMCGGFSSVQGGFPTTGICMLYTSNSPYLGFVAANASSYTTNYTTVAPIPNTWYISTISFSADGTASAVCSINDTNSVTFTNNLPSAKGVMLEFGITKKDGTDSRVFELDYEYVGFGLSTSR